MTDNQEQALVDQIIDRGPILSAKIDILCKLYDENKPVGKDVSDRMSDLILYIFDMLNHVESEVNYMTDMFYKNAMAGRARRNGR